MPLLRTTGGRLVLLAALLAVLVIGNVVRGARTPQGIEVDSMIVDPGEFTVDVTASGVTGAADPVEIRAPLNGRLVAVEVEPGDQAEPDQVIARYDAEDLRVQVGRLQQELAQARAQLAELLDRRQGAREQAEAQRTQAQSRLRQARLALQELLVLPPWDPERKQAEERVNEAEAALAELESRLAAEQVTPEQVAAARASVTAAETALAQAQAQLTDVELRTPQGGTVLEVPVEPGEAVAPGQLIARIAHLDVV
ncbi:MAG TPA: biotin/lipoyl-binding protein, partial [Bacillota bacterium]